MNDKSENQIKIKSTSNQHQSSSLQLINPTSSAYVALTPTAQNSINHHQSQSQSFKSFSSPKFNRTTSTSTSSSTYSPTNSTLRLSTSQHTLKTLSGGKYYDEYDEDDSSDLDQLPPLPNSAASSSNRFSPHQASFPPASTPNSTPIRTHPNSPLSHHHHSNRPPLRLNLQSSNSIIIDLTPPSASSPTNRQSLIASTPNHEPFNLFSIEDWNSFSLQRPLLSLGIKLGALLLGSALVLSSLIWILLPPVAEEHRSMLTLPTSFDALKKLNELLQVSDFRNLSNGFILMFGFS